MKVQFQNELQPVVAVHVVSGGVPRAAVRVRQRLGGILKTLFEVAA